MARYVTPGASGKLRLETKAIAADAAGAEHGRHGGVVRRASLLGMDGKQPLPLREGPIRPVKFLQRERAEF